MPNKNNPTIQTQFTCTYEDFTYLGIKINPDIKKIVSINYDPLVKKGIGLLRKMGWDANFYDRSH